MAMIAINLVLAVVFGSLAIFVEQQSRWVAFVDMALVGFNLAQAVNARNSMLNQRAFYQMRAAYNAMHELNNDLVTGQFEAMIVRRRTDGDDDAPIAPTKLN